MDTAVTLDQILLVTIRDIINISANSIDVLLIIGYLQACEEKSGVRLRFGDLSLGNHEVCEVIHKLAFLGYINLNQTEPSNLSNATVRITERGAERVEGWRLPCSIESGMKNYSFSQYLQDL